MLAAIVLVVVAVGSLVLGARSVSPGTVWDAVWHYDPTVDDQLVVRDLRVPRTVLGLAVGAALGAAGVLLQGMTRNPLADPGLLGVEAGASLAVVLAIASGAATGPEGYVWFALGGAAVASAAVVLVGSVGRTASSTVRLTLAGAALASLLGSLTSAVVLLDERALDRYRFWAVGSVAGRGGDVVVQVLPFLAVGAVLALAAARSLDGLALGDDVARSLGHRVAWGRALALLGVVVLCGAATAACGPIAFVGLTVPHVARAICGPDHRWIVPWSLVLGAILLVAADIVGRFVVQPGELQTGIVTALVGAPVFIVLVRRRNLVRA